MRMSRPADFRPVPAPHFEPPPQYAAAGWSPPPRSDLWALARDGDPEAAYRALADRTRVGSAVEDDYLQLYWLLAASPGLDGAMDPGDWLIRGFPVCGPYAWRLRELLDRQAAFDPDWVASPRFAALIAGPIPPGPALMVAAWRWRAARRRRAWDLIARDVDALRAWAPEATPHGWARLLLLAAENVTWATGSDRSARDAYRAEAERVADEHAIDVEEELARFEYADAVAGGINRRGWAGLAEDDLPALLRDHWDDRGLALRPRLRALAGRVALAPAAALTRFDKVLKVAPAALGLLRDLLGGWPDPRPDPATNFAVRRFLAASGYLSYPARASYARLRPRLLEFCLAERLAPPVVARAVELTLGDGVTLAHAIAHDWPLLLVCRACELDGE